MVVLGILGAFPDFCNNSERIAVQSDPFLDTDEDIPILSGHCIPKQDNCGVD